VKIIGQRSEQEKRNINIIFYIEKNLTGRQENQDDIQEIYQI
jgi:hypothetical protein